MRNKTGLLDSCWSLPTRQATTSQLTAAVVGNSDGVYVGALVEGTLVGCDVGCTEGYFDKVYEDGRDK